MSRKEEQEATTSKKLFKKETAISHLRNRREAIFKTLFEKDLNPDIELFDALETAKEDYNNLTEEDNDYIFRTVEGVIANLKAIDELIGKSSSEWKINRMAAVDRAILRLATFEMKFAKEKLTSNIAINEAVELAKKYGADESRRFVNGVLSGIIKN